MGYLVNIDNGGTLTDICVVDQARVYRTKTLTTPHDLSRCLLDGLTKASRSVYGEDDLVRLLTSTDHIRYSTTQGTNALVERKGPSLGLVTSGSLGARALREEPHADGLYDTLVGERAVALDLTLPDDALRAAVVQAVNTLGSAGANRIVVAHGGADRAAQETRLKNLLLRAFPQHLLGAVPILYSHEVVEDDDDVRRTWTALLNAFLHPAMERFLYSAEHRLRDHKAQNPLLVFRNDGHSARVAKTIALKTYSSGPRAGMEGARAVAGHYGYKHLLTMDIGGTTTDIGEVAAGEVRADRRGRVEGIEVSFPLCDVVSVGIGGSSIIRVSEGSITVGPDSVGSAPGPACFALGGTEATITDACLVMGLLDTASFFGGDLALDLARARDAIESRIGGPLGLSIEAAALAMEQAWVDSVARHLREFTGITSETVLAAFGGAGPLVVCRIAQAAGISRVLIPGLAAVFSAFGLGYSDIAHEYAAPLASATAADLDACLADLHERAQAGMYAEGFELADCELASTLHARNAAGERAVTLRDRALPADLPAGARLSVSLTVARRLPQPVLRGQFGTARVAATPCGVRRIQGAAGSAELPVFRAEEQACGAEAIGPAVLEEAYFTCRVDAGWRFEINDNGDILLSRT